VENLDKPTVQRLTEKKMERRSARVLFLTVGDEASPGTRLRALAYRPYLEERGYRVDSLFPLGSDPNQLRRRRLLRPLELLRDLASASRADVVVVYRKTFPGLTARLLRKISRTIVYEYDDAVYLPSPEEPQGEESIERYQRNFRSTVASANLVVAGNHHLAEKAAHEHTVVLPTGVDLSIFKPGVRATTADRCTLGWIGTAGNLPQWSRLIPVFERVVAENPAVRLKVVSDGEPPECPLPLEYERFTIEREAACLEDFDIGLMPLGPLTGGDERGSRRGWCQWRVCRNPRRVGEPAPPSRRRPGSAGHDGAIRKGGGRAAILPRRDRFEDGGVH
jgi:glycosyltransferase involved in cell wall biosynthesis